MAELNYTCAHCGAGFSASRKTKIYCSRKCNHEAWVKRNPNSAALNRQRERKRLIPQYTRVSFNTCGTCGNSFISKRKKKYCCDECKPKSKWVSIAPELKKCLCCGSRYSPPFTGGGVSDYCSDECRLSVKRALKRIYKAKRKAVLRGATIERVDPFVVFERDKWMCRLCGCKTPQKKRGTYSDNAPELDHIKPLSKGGEHSYMNTQCLCRKCNGLKSDRLTG